MAKSFHGRVLRVNLSSGAIERVDLPESFYRTYMGGASFGAWFLLKETAPDLDALAPGNLLTIAPSVLTGARVSGVSRCSVSALSPLTGVIGDGQAGGDLGPMVKRAGVDAIVIEGQADRPVYLYVDSQTAEIREAGTWWGSDVLTVADGIDERYGTKGVGWVQCGPAGEKLVRFANLLAGRNDVIGRTGMGAVFGSKNLRAVVVRGDGDVPMADPDALKVLSRLAAKRRPDAGFPSTLFAQGTPGVLSPQAEGGNLATHNFSRSYHADHALLSGDAMEEAGMAAGGTTCWGCVVSCRKRVKLTKGKNARHSYDVTDGLGGPEFETLGLLGSNLDIVDVGLVAKANELCNNHGIDTITMGAIAGYLFESMESGLVDAQATGGRELRFGDGEGLLWLIEQIVTRQGIGDVLADGFEAGIAQFGEATRPFAIHVKGQGLAVHMAQVKPTMALLYAVSPIGADHQSCEHDWLMGSEGEDRKGLGILDSSADNPGSADDLAKVRMTAYGQFFYGLLDTLSLCQFVWGPGSLYTYQEFEQLVEATTGWQATMWELMKVGERRVNLMRQLNARRGFGREQDVLPKRVNEPLPDGPAKGRHVDPERFERVLDEYYALLGWDPATGTPLPGKLMELGLEWTLP